MKCRQWVLALIGSCTLASLPASAATRYVWQDSPSPGPPHDTWATAAHTIQDAIDTALAGDEIVVTNGVYATGGRAVYGTMTNRVAVIKPLRVVSMNGPAVTVIQGYQLPETRNGDGAVRCVYLTNGAVLSGFALTNGGTRTSGEALAERSGGGVRCESTNVVLTNCLLTGNSASFSGGGASDGTLNNCTLTSNAVYWYGGGASSGTLNNCMVLGNSSSRYGGGAHGATLNMCTLTGNSSANYGGGASECSLFNCTLGGNSAPYGGGGYSGTVNNSTLLSNSAASGGGTYSGTVNNSTLTGNSAGYGGGASGGILSNCTLTDNWASTNGGGAYGGTLNGCIVYYNRTCGSESNYSGGLLNYCCTTPQPMAGTGNITKEPELASASHLSAGSPCRGTGSAAYAVGKDIDGEAWANPPSIGCDEYWPGAITGALEVAVQTLWTNIAVGFVLDFKSEIRGATSTSRWEFGDGTVISNRPYVTHRWLLPGNYEVVLTAFNESYPAGVSATTAVHVVSAIHYVASDSDNPVAPYSSWATAARNIQDAVDVASAAGALVLVTNGVYQTGGRVVYGALSNRVAVMKPVRVESVNGPATTAIEGFRMPETVYGDSAVRCVYLGSGAALAGFTLTQGATRSSGDSDREQSGGGVWCESPDEIVTNCVLVGNSAAYIGGGACWATLRNCTLSSNSAGYGGAASYGALENCTLTGNSARYDGAGTYYGTLKNCRLAANSASRNGGATAYGKLDNCSLDGNSAPNLGGGAYYGTLKDCTVSSNSAGTGGGASYGTLSNCTVVGNSAFDGGGAYSAFLTNCILKGNSGYNGGGSKDCSVQNCMLTGNSAYFGGGSRGGTLQHCTLTANSATYGGGAFEGNLNNCIAFYNSCYKDGTNHLYANLNYCCAPEPPNSGWQNITDDPKLASASHLSAESPCRGAGLPAYALGVDIDGEPWVNPPSIGCDEYRIDAVSGLLSVALRTAWTDVTVGFALDLTADIDGRTSASRWDFGDGTVVSNRPYATHQWLLPGDYQVVLTAFNESYPAGVSATTVVHVASATHYVAPDSANPVAPYSSWATAATNIQDAVDATSVAGALVLVTNGVYQTGGRVVAGAMSNRLALTKPVTVRSVNGPGVTMIQGYQVPGTTNGDAAVRCAYLTNGAVLSGFTLTNGATRSLGDSDHEQRGGGVWCESADAVVANCVLAGNSSDRYGGGAYGGSLNNCTLIGNRTGNGGGGAAYSLLNNCTLTRNTAAQGGGTFQGFLKNCIVYFNTAPFEANHTGSNKRLEYCCTPQRSSGIGNFTQDPLLVDYASGDLRLQSNSPCINAGRNAYASSATDLDGLPRIVGGTVDIGAYEFQAPTSVLSYAWLQQFGLPTDGSADFTDPDGDHQNNSQEWEADTNPTNALSCFRISAISNGPPVAVRFPSSPNRIYTLVHGSNVTSTVDTPVPDQTDIPGTGGVQALQDTNAAAARFYRVRVSRP